MTSTKTIRGTPDEVRKFGILFAVICILVAAYMAWKGMPPWPYFSAGAVFFLLTGFIAQRILRPLYIGWMKFAFVLGWVNTRVLLGLFFYLILTPIGLILRLTGKDLLGLKIDRNASSYWVKRERKPFDRERAKQQF